MLNMWVQKRREMQLILFARSTVRSKSVCAKNTEIKGREVGSGAWAQCAYFDLYRQSKNKRTEWKCRGHGGDMKASAEASNIQDNRKEALFGRQSDEHLRNSYPRADSCCVQTRGSK